MEWCSSRGRSSEQWGGASSKVLELERAKICQGLQPSSAGRSSLPSQQIRIPACTFRPASGDKSRQCGFKALINPNRLPMYSPTIALLSINSHELKINIYPQTCPQMVITALFIIIGIRKLPRCPSVGVWINKLRYSQTMEYQQQQKEMSYWAIIRHERNFLLNFAVNAKLL